MFNPEKIRDFAEVVLADSKASKLREDLREFFVQRLACIVGLAIELNNGKTGDVRLNLDLGRVDEQHFEWETGIVTQLRRTLVREGGIKSNSASAMVKVGFRKIVVMLDTGVSNVNDLKKGRDGIPNLYSVSTGRRIPKRGGA